MGENIDLEILVEFVEEAKVLLDQWESCVYTLEKEYIDADFNKLARLAHNLKGSSQSLGLMEFGNFVHKVEDFMIEIKNAKRSLRPHEAKILLDTHSILMEWLEKAKDEPQFMPDLSGITVQIMSSEQHSEVHTEKQTTPHADTEVEPINESMLDELKVSTDSTSTKKAIPVKNTEVLRISKDKIDALFELVGELSIQQTIVAHTARDFDHNNELLQKSIALSSKLVKQIQEQTLTLRMHPIEPVFKRLIRAAKDVAREIQKEIEVVMVGEDVELDKLIIDQILEPLLHIVRNAVDHGIETLEGRLDANKPGVATIRIEAYQEPTSVGLIIADDGRGIDPAKILQKAIEKGLASREIQYSKDEI